MSEPVVGGSTPLAAGEDAGTPRALGDMADPPSIVAVETLLPDGDTFVGPGSIAGPRGALVASVPSVSPAPPDPPPGAFGGRGTSGAGFPAF